MNSLSTVLDAVLGQVKNFNQVSNIPNI